MSAENEAGIKVVLVFKDMSEIVWLVMSFQFQRLSSGRRCSVSSELCCGLAQYWLGKRQLVIRKRKDTLALASDSSHERRSEHSFIMRSLF